MTNNKAETNRYTQTDRIQNPSSENLKCFTRDFFTRDFCSKNVLPGKNPGKWEKFTRKKNYDANNKGESQVTLGAPTILAFTVQNTPKFSAL